MSSSAQSCQSLSLEAMMSSCSAAVGMRTYTLATPTLSDKPPCRESQVTFLDVQWLLQKNERNYCWYYEAPENLTARGGRLSGTRHRQQHCGKIPLLTSFHHEHSAHRHTHKYTRVCVCACVYTLSPNAPLSCRDSFVTKMNSSSALQPKQVI